MKTKIKFLYIAMIVFTITVLSCKKKDPVVPKSAEKTISVFSFAALTPAVNASISGTNITATVPVGKDLTKLVPTITLSPKAKVTPASGVVQDFSKDVTYTVTAENGTTQAYKVTVTAGVATAKSPAKIITGFAFNGISPAVIAKIDTTTKTITASVSAATDITKLIPTITVSEKATVSPATGVVQDFSKEVSYTVTAEDASTQIYKVAVTKENTQIGAISEKNITTIPDNTDFQFIQGAVDNPIIPNGNGSLYLLARSQSADGLKYVYEYTIASNKWTQKTDLVTPIKEKIIGSYLESGKTNLVVFDNTAKSIYNLEIDFTKNPATYAKTITWNGSLNGPASFPNFIYDKGRIYFDTKGYGHRLLDVNAKSIATFDLKGYPGAASKNIYGQVIVDISAANGKFFVLGTNTDKNTFDFYEYNISTNAWTAKAIPPSVSKKSPDASFTIGNKIYFSFKDDKKGISYDTETDKWSELDATIAYTNAFRSTENERFKYTVSDGNSIYYQSGKSTYQILLTK